MAAIDAAALGFDLDPFPADHGNHVADTGAGDEQAGLESIETLCKELGVDRLQYCSRSNRINTKFSVRDNVGSTAPGQGPPSEAGFLGGNDRRLRSYCCARGQGQFRHACSNRQYSR